MNQILVVVLVLIAFCFIRNWNSVEQFSSVADPRNFGSAQGCCKPKCDVARKRKCNVNFSGYEITPLRTSGFDVTPLHNLWSDPDYLGDAGWCSNPHNPTPCVEWVDPPVLDYHIKNPNFCYNSFP